MRGGALPPALLCAALGLALAFAPRRAWGPSFVALAVTATVVAIAPVPPGWLEGVFLGCWMSVAASAALAVGRTVTTDASGNASFAAYITISNGAFSPGDPGHVCFPNLSAATLSLTIDGNPPGASNVAYRSTLVRNDIPTC